MITENIRIETADFKNTPEKNKRYSLIWLHGLGASADNFVPMGKELENLVNLPICFVFPQAPHRSVTLNNGMTMPAWYDITGLGLEAREDREGLDHTVQKIKLLIQSEIGSGIPAENIFLGGFSQGGAAAIYAGLHLSEKLAGVIVFSGYLPFYKNIDKNIDKEKRVSNQDTPIFWAQGSEDTVVLPAWGKVSVQALKSAHFSVDFRTYPMAHQVCQAQMQDFAEWLMRVSKAASITINNIVKN